MISLGLYDWVNIITGVFFAYTLYKYMEVFFDIKKTNKTLELISYILYYLISTIINFSANVPIVLLISNILIFFCLTYNYESNLKKRILAVVLIYLVLMIVELTAGLLLSGALNFYLFTANNYSSAYGLIVSRILSFIVALGLNNFKNIRRGESVPTSNWICIALIPVSSLYIILLLFQANGLSVVQVFAGIAVLFLINFTTFYLYDVITAAQAEKMQSLLILVLNLILSSVFCFQTGIYNDNICLCRESHLTMSKVMVAFRQRCW